MWHQIRYMMSVLFSIANGSEQPTIIDQLLNVDKVTEMPNYVLAPPENLLLSDCGFEDVRWTN